MVGWRHLVLASCLLVGLPGFLWSQTPRVIVVGNNAPPYRIFADGQAHGIYIDAFRAIAELVGLVPEFQEVPMARALVMMQEGRADLMLGPNRTAERDVFMDFLTDAFPGEPKVFYTPPGTHGITQYDDLSGRVIATLRGSVYFERFDADTSLKKDEVTDYAQAFRKVAAARDDAVVAPEVLGDYLVRQLGLTLVKGAYRVEGRPSSIAISRKSRALRFRDAIEVAVATIKANGTWDRILARYR